MSAGVSELPVPYDPFSSDTPYWEPVHLLLS
jgi:hypothetical protein